MIGTSSKSFELIFNKRYDPDPAGKDGKPPKNIEDMEEEHGDSGTAIYPAEWAAGKDTKTGEVTDESKVIPKPRVGETPFGEGGGFIPSPLGFSLRDNKYVTPLTGTDEQDMKLQGDGLGRGQKVREVAPAAMATESIESAERHKSLVSIFKDIDSSDDGATTRRSDNQSKNPADHKCVGCGGQADTFALFGRQDSKGNRNYLSDKKTKEPVAMTICNSCSKELASLAAERGVHIIPESGSEFSKDTNLMFNKIENLVEPIERISKIL